jgi:hypothetical protein
VIATDADDRDLFAGVSERASWDSLRMLLPLCGMALIRARGPALNWLRQKGSCECRAGALKARLKKATSLKIEILVRRHDGIRNRSYRTPQAPVPFSNICRTSLWVESMGNPCGRLVIGLSYRSETL